jgi:RNA polymerase sigma factor (sigma-70 family)
VTDGGMPTVQDDDGFVLLYRQHRSALVWHVRSHGASEAEATDAVQDAFAAALRAGGRIRDGRAWPAWLRTVALRSYLRGRRGADGLLVLVADPPDLVAATGSVGDAVEAHREEELVLSMLAALPARQREVFGLHYEGWSTAEIAARLSMGQPAVRQNLARARRTLRESISEKEGAPE